MLRRWLPVLFLALLLTSCRGQRDSRSNQDFNREELSSLPQAVQDWAENSRTMHIAHTKVFQGRRYILASLGEMPTGGYGIVIEDVDIGQDKITVTVNHTAPGPDQAVPEMLTYPQDIVSVANLDLPLEYIATGDMEYIPVLRGIEELPQITAQSQAIKVIAPAPGAKVQDNFTIEGVANVFEGDFSYLLRDAGRTPTEEEHALAGMGDWYYFSQEMTVPEGFSPDFTLELFSRSAKDGSIINLVEVPLNREQAGN